MDQLFKIQFIRVSKAKLIKSFDQPATGPGKVRILFNQTIFFPFGYLLSSIMRQYKEKNGYSTKKIDIHLDYLMPHCSKNNSLR